MKTRTLKSPTTSALLTLDAASAELNTVSHARERCALDSESLCALGSAVNRQVLVRRSSEHVALYTIAERVAAPGPEVHVGTAGAQRLADALRSPARVTLATDFTTRTGRARIHLTEDLLGDDAASGLAILAPHGGLIEPGTDDQAEVVHDLLAQHALPVVALSGPLAGVQPENIVNRVTVAGNGIQIEQPRTVRDDPRQRGAVAGAVAELYAELL